ncbi:hypothetical protein LguiA_022435 [Lonicera macranthoides]
MAIDFTFSLLFSLISISTAFSKASAADPAVELWCVAKNNAEDSALQAALDWACSTGGADCGLIQQGGPCYDPADLERTASYAFNDYFLKHGMTNDACNFDSTAALTSLNPSHSNCRFPSSLTVKNRTATGSSIVGMGPVSADLSGGNSVTPRSCWPLLPVLLLISITRIY